ncbi:hypothetical protein LAUMK142_05347 [Mycobacterium pseudokansasii]|uniref:Uncharacterized protein n=1 Tax=Mycobacterium pseudokansasii TaxID=2341080 RepID=A0A498R1M5_9MYCO|nr:hypothetical protein LAUMK142_05347 [Mycobacterium pseudokansasii]
MTADVRRPVRYLSRAEVAERIGVKPDTLGRYNLPEPDAVIGTVRGWLPRTIDRWNRARPSRRA